MIRRCLRVGACMVAVAMVLLLGNCYRRFGEARQSHEMAEVARARVAVGMTRSEAVALLAADAWHHGHCEYDGATRHYDLFLYGTHDLDGTGVVLLISVTRPPEEDVRVVFVGSHENERLFLLDDCSSLNLSRVRRWWPW